MYDQLTNDSFCKKLGSVQYNAALAITGAVKGTSQVKLYKELGLESLKLRTKLRLLCTFYKIKTTCLPSYLFCLITNTVHSYQTRTMDNVTKYQCRTEAFKSSFFPWTITEWNSLDLQIRNLSYTAFRKHFIDEFRLVPNSVFNIHNPVGIKLLTRLRLGLSHLNEHRFNHKFQNCTNPKCVCSSENESTTHFSLHCSFYIPVRATLFDKLKEIVSNLQDFSDQTVTEMLLYDSRNLKDNQNSQILNYTIKYIMDSKRFTGSLF